jgi:hypothetical protein
MDSRNIRKLVASILIFVSFYGLCAAQTQRLEFFEKTGCQNRTDTIYNFNYSLDSIDHIANAASVGVFGL